ncbi:MAG TPA: YXWGXW repeat-containing protein [Lacunisphaera sp.]
MNTINIPRTVGHAGFAIRPVMQATIIAGAALLAGCESTPESHVVSAPPPSAPGTVVVAQPQPTQPSQVVVVQAPPAVQQEAVTARPSSDHVWIAGYWTWRDNRYEWIAGRWEVPPHSSATWIAPRWERLSDGTYRFYEGYWN